MVKEQINASTITNMSHSIKPTIDSEVFNINYGLETFTISRRIVLQCLDSYYDVRQKQNEEIQNKLDELFFNKNNKLLYLPHFYKKLLSDNPDKKFPELNCLLQQY